MKVLTFGETMALGAAAETGPLPHASMLKLGVGGSESNVAIALRRLGVDVTWAGRLGQDSFGDLVERELRAEQVGLALVRDPEAPTGLMIKERRTADATRVWYYRSGSAGSRLCPDDLPDELIEAADLLHITGITPALSETALRATVHAVQHARARGIPVSLDLNYRSALWSAEQAGSVYRQLIPMATMVFAGADEAALAVGPGDPETLAARLVEAGPTECVIKLGAQGCVAAIDGRSYRAPAVSVSVIDPVGAGDGFVAGYLAERSADRPAESRLRTAVTVGAFACTVQGDWEGYPRRAELDLLSGPEPVSR